MTDAVLRRLGIDPGRFRVLLGLFQKLSDRKEFLNQQLGFNAGSLKAGALLNAVMGTLLGGLLMLGKPSPDAYLGIFLFLTAFLLMAIVMAETAHTLVNPEEGMVLVHMPINGATYTSAKLIHLGRVVVYMAGSLNGVPALLGWTLADASPYYPVMHLASAAALGIGIAFCCCAFFGWMMRFIPPSRMKAASQVAMGVPYVVMMPQFHVMEFLGRMWKRAPDASPYLGVGAAVVVLVGVVVGLRSLSVDYLIRVTRIVQGGSRRKAAGTRNRGVRAVPGKLVSRWMGGPAARAGFAYLLRMIARDWQFRRQLLSFLPSLLLIAASARSFRNPFDTRFSGVHVLPHAFGAFAFLVCTILKTGAHPKGVWIFQLGPAGAFTRFAAGVYAALWMVLVAAPHVLVGAASFWLWPAQDAVLFNVYSLALATLYLSLSLKSVDGLPFCHPAEAAQTYWVLPVMLVGGIVAAIVVAGQHFVLFRSEMAVIVVTLLVAVAALDTGRRSIGGLAGSMRFFLSTLGEEKTSLYREVG